jgi:hypothetical protein
MSAFRLIRIDINARNISQVDEGLSEFDAWHYSYEMQKIERYRYRRRYWYLVTDRLDWEAYAKEFMYYKLDFVLPTLQH